MLTYFHLATKQFLSGAIGRVSYNHCVMCFVVDLLVLILGFCILC